MPAPNSTTYFPRRIILAGALISGMLLALAAHMLGQRFGLNIAALWQLGSEAGTPAAAAVAWWLISSMAFVGGFYTASLMDSAVSGQLPRPLRGFLIAILIVVLAAAGQAATGPSAIPTIAGVLTGVAALAIGAVMAFCGAHFALRRA
jgi:hypothetical protein